jgi:hypothetical protein
VKFKNDKEFQSANQIVKTNGKFMLSIIKAWWLFLIWINRKHLWHKWIYRKKNNKYGVVNSENKLVENIEYDDFKIIKEYILFSKNKNIKNITEYLINNCFRHYHSEFER